MYRASNLDITRDVSHTRTDYDFDFAQSLVGPYRPTSTVDAPDKPTFAQRCILLFFTWCSAPLTGFLIFGAALPLIIVVWVSPILMASGSLIEVLSDLSHARAIANGSATLSYDQMPLYTLLLMSADWLALRVPFSAEEITVGRIYLIAKCLFSLGVAFALSLIVNIRLPVLSAMLVSCAVVLMALNPFGGAGSFASAILMVLLLTTLCAPSTDTKLRALLEGVFCGIVLTGLLLTIPVMFFAGVIALTACPYLSGQYRGVRYLMFVGSFIFSSIALFLFAPNLFSIAIEELFKWGSMLQDNFTNMSVGWIGKLWNDDLINSDIFINLIVWALIFVSVIIVSNVKAISVFFASLILCVVALALAFSGLIVAKPFIFMAVIILCFTVKTPLYKELYNRPSRTGYSIAFLLAGLTFMQGVFVLAPLSQRLEKQYQLANQFESDIEMSSLEKRFSIALVDRYVDLASGQQNRPKDHSKKHAHQGLEALVSIIDEYQENQAEVAILTEFDFLCMLGNKQPCFPSGQEAAKQANIVFVPHIEFGPQTQATLEKSQVFLYTHFKRTDQTRHWDVWERRSQ